MRLLNPQSILLQHKELLQNNTEDSQSKEKKGIKIIKEIQREKRY